MKTLIQASWIAFLLFTGCTHSNNSDPLVSLPDPIVKLPAPSTTPLVQTIGLTGRWQLEQIRQDGNVINKPNPYDSRLQIQLALSPNDSIAGTTSTNIFMGIYRTKGSDSLTVTEFSQTKIGETLWGRLFTDDIRNVKTYSLTPDTLRLYIKPEHQFIFIRVLPK